MATPAVQAASCAGAATAVITTTVIVVPTAENEPAYDPFSSAPNNSDNKIIKDFWPFLIDTGSSSSNKNKDWWEWSFKRLKAEDKKNLDDAFKKPSLKEGFKSFTNDGNENAVSLNELCHWIIKNKGTTDITSDKANTPLAKNVWKYCSPLDNPPLTVEQAKTDSEYKGKIGASKKADVISLNWNDKFWILKDLWLKNSGTSTAPSDNFFNPYKTASKTLKEACEKAYKIDTPTNGTSTAEKPTADAVSKFCAFKVHTS